MVMDSARILFGERGGIHSSSGSIGSIGSGSGTSPGSGKKRRVRPWFLPAAYQNSDGNHGGEDWFLRPHDAPYRDDAGAAESRTPFRPGLLSDSRGGGGGDFRRPLSPSSFFTTTAASSAPASSSPGEAAELHRPPKGTWKDAVFGFMYEEDDGVDGRDAGTGDAEFELYHSVLVEPASTLLCGPQSGVHVALFVSLFLFAFANAVPVTLIPSFRDMYDSPEDADASVSASAASASATATHLATAAVLGTSVGKLVSGPVVDVCGARRASSLYTFGLSLALLAIAGCPFGSPPIDNQQQGRSSAAALLLPRILYGAVEFCSAVQWPGAVVVLAAHHRGNPRGGYEGGICVTSLAVRAGALAGIVVPAALMRWGSVPWRAVALLGSWSALLSVAVTYLHVQDAPFAPDEPQNPVDPNLVRKWFPDYYYSASYAQRSDDGFERIPRTAGDRRRLPSLGMYLRLAAFVFRANVVPSLQHILRSPVFWIVAVAHTGCAMVRTSDRVLSSYLADTATLRSSTTASSSYGGGGGEPATWASDPASGAGASAFLGLGTVLGLAVAGSLFATRAEREKKWLVSKMYLLTVASCYALSILAVPAVSRVLRPSDDPGLLTVLQTIAVAVAGFGIAVPLYHIPSLVGAGFGCDKGLFLSYVDGVAYGLASLVWRVVGDAVQHTQDGSGWAYGWAAVALLVIPCAILMVEFMEHYFCRHRYGGTLETILIA